VLVVDAAEVQAALSHELDEGWAARVDAAPDCEFPILKDLLELIFWPHYPDT